MSSPAKQWLRANGLTSIDPQPRHRLWLRTLGEDSAGNFIPEVLRFLRGDRRLGLQHALRQIDARDKESLQAAVRVANGLFQMRRGEEAGALLAETAIGAALDSDPAFVQSRAEMRLALEELRVERSLQFALQRRRFKHVVDGHDLVRSISDYSDAEAHMTHILPRAAPHESVLAHLIQFHDNDNDPSDRPFTDLLADAVKAYQCMKSLVDRLREDHSAVTPKDVIDCMRDVHTHLTEGYRVRISVSKHGTAEYIYLAGGQFRTSICGSVNRRIMYRDPALIPTDMHNLATKLIEALSDNRIPVIKISAWMFHLLIMIHPFDDGNGRFTRLFSSLPLLLRHDVLLGFVPDAKGETARRAAYFLACDEAEGIARQNENCAFDGIKRILPLVVFMVEDTNALAEMIAREEALHGTPADELQAASLRGKPSEAIDINPRMNMSVFNADDDEKAIFLTLKAKKMESGPEIWSSPVLDSSYAFNSSEDTRQGLPYKKAGDTEQYRASQTVRHSSEIFHCDM